MKTLDKIIKEICRHVWKYNPYYDKLQENSQIILHTYYALELINTYCKIILESTNNDTISTCVNEIIKLTYGDNIPPEEKVKDFIKNSKNIVDIIINHCNDGINICKTENDNKIVVLSEKYKNKFLYFEGYESGSVIIFIKNIHYNGANIKWEGAMIDLPTVNSQYGHGINITYIEDGSFEELPYFDNAYDSRHGFDENLEVGSIEYLDKWLSFNEYGNILNGNKNSRELTEEQVKAVIGNQLYWGFESMADDGVDMPNPYIDCNLY